MRYEQMRREVREGAVRLLSRREHSIHELALKPRHNGVAETLADPRLPWDDADWIQWA